MTSTSAPRRRPDGRYDEPSLVGQRVLAVLLAALFIGLLTAVGFLLYDRFVSPQTVRGRVIGFDVQTDDRVVIDVEVSKPSGSKAYCVIRARGADGAEVGRDVAVLDAAGTQEPTARAEFPLTTTARAVTGELGQCTERAITVDDVTR